MKNNAKGITLIALVITIIVLLILAGATIATLTGDNGILGKANNAKIENEKAEIKEMLSLAVNTIAIEQGQKQDSLSNYYEDKETFIENGKLDTQKYKVNDYQYDGENNIVTITMYKENGTKNQYEYEINLKTGSIEFKNKGEIVDPNKANKISYETNGGSFAEGTNVVTEYKKGDSVGFISPEKEGAAFDGWYLNSNFDGESINKTTKDMNGDITVYAKWVEETDSNYFTYNGSTITGFSDAGKEAFKEGKVKTLVIPKKHGETEINAIGSSAFENCSTDKNTNKIDIEKLVLQDNVIQLNNCTFKNCTSINELTMPISLDTVPNSNYVTFEKCNAITNIKFTKGTGIGYSYGNEGRIEYTPWGISKANDIKIELEEGITSIGNNTFANCTGIKNLSIPTTITSIGTKAFYNCSNMVGELNTIDNVTSIGDEAFKGCTGINGTLNIPTGMKKINKYSFEGTSIEKLVIPDNIIELDYGSFANCVSLKYLSIPISLDTIPNSNFVTFSGCESISKVRFTKGTGEGWDYNNSWRTQYTPWYISRNNEMSIILENGINSIGNYTFYGLGNASFYYTGTQEQWDAITKNANNTSINNITCNYKE